jgi:hypothetical protein
VEKESAESSLGKRRRKKKNLKFLVLIGDLKVEEGSSSSSSSLSWTGHQRCRHSRHTYTHRRKKYDGLSLSFKVSFFLNGL